MTLTCLYRALVLFVVDNIYYWVAKHSDIFVVIVVIVTININPSIVFIKCAMVKKLAYTATYVNILFTVYWYFVFIMYSFNLQAFIQGNAINVWLLAGICSALAIIRQCTVAQGKHLITIFFILLIWITHLGEGLILVVKIGKAALHNQRNIRRF